MGGVSWDLNYYSIFYSLIWLKIVKFLKPGQILSGVPDAYLRALFVNHHILIYSVMMKLI